MGHFHPSCSEQFMAERCGATCEALKEMHPESSIPPPPDGTLLSMTVSKELIFTQ